MHLPLTAPATRVRRPGTARRLLGWACLLVIAWLPATVRAARAPAAAGRVHTIVFFGDSLTAGHGLADPATQAYPALIQRKIDAAHLPWRVINAGVSGDTTASGLRRVDWILRRPVDIFFLALGANDGLRGIDPAVTRQNLVAIIARVRARDPRVNIVLAAMMMPPSMGESFTRRFAAVYPAVARETHVTLAPFLLEGVALRPDLNQSDGIHPTAAGDRVIADHVWQFLRPLL